MAGIVAATMLGLVYLTQTMGTNATSSEIRALEAQRSNLMDSIGRQVRTVDEALEAELVIKGAKKAGLKRLDLDDVRVLSAP